MQLKTQMAIVNRSFRKRQLKPSLFSNEQLGEADPLLMLLFQSLWCMADREGRLEDRPMKIKAFAFPYRMIDRAGMDKMLDWLAAEDFIQRYSIEGKRYIQIMTFGEHQDIHPHEARSVIPPNPVNIDVRECNDIGDQCKQMYPLTSYTSFPSCTALPSGEYGDEASPVVVQSVEKAVEIPKAASKEADILEKGVRFLTSHKSITERSARSLLGRLAKQHSGPELATALAATFDQKPIDPTSFLIGVLRKRAKDKAGMHVGEWDGQDDCKPLPVCGVCGSDVCLGGQSCADRAAARRAA